MFGKFVNKKPSKKSEPAIAERSVVSPNRYGPLATVNEDSNAPNTLLTKDVVTTLKSHAEEKVKVLEKGAITHTLEAIFESKYTSFPIIHL